MIYDTCVFVRQSQRHNKVRLEENRSDKTRKKEISYGHFCPAKKCPNSLFAASAPPLWATSKINGDHYHSHATQTLLVQLRRSSLIPAPHTHCGCLTKHAFSYGSEMSGVTPINGGQENTEGLRCCLGRDKVALTWSVLAL